MGREGFVRPHGDFDDHKESHERKGDDPQGAGGGRCGGAEGGLRGIVGIVIYGDGCTDRIRCDLFFRIGGIRG